MTITLEITPDDYLLIKQDELIHKLYCHTVLQRIYEAVDRKAQSNLVEAEQFIHLREELSPPDIELDTNIFQGDQN